MIWISEWLTLGLAFTVAAACVGRRELMAGEVSPVHLPRSLSSGSRFLLVAGQCEMIVSCLSSYSSFDFFNGVCCRQVKPLRTSLLLFSTTLITIPSDEAWNQFLTHVVTQEDARTRAMILLAYDAALRREELMSLRVDDIDWAREMVTIRPETTKNGRMRYVPVSAAVLHLVRQYIEGDRRALIAAYDSEDLGLIFLSESTRNPGCPLVKIGRAHV